MPHEIFMPKLSSTMAEGTLIEWFKNEGDPVEVGEPILEIMTDKINIEVEAYNEGTLLKKYYATDDVVPVNHVIGYIGQEGEEVSENPPGESEELSQDDKKTEQDSIIETNDTAAKVNKTDTDSQSLPDSSESKLNKPRATPAARALARNKNIEIQKVSGSGRHGRIHKQDVEQHKPVITAPSDKTVKSDDSSSAIKKEKLKGVRKITADRIAESSSTIPHVTIDFEVEMDHLIELRNYINQKNISSRISFNDLFTFISSKALTEHPDINITFENNEIHYHDSNNIGIAVAVDKDLFVPVIKNTEIKSLLTLSEEIRDLVRKSRDKKLDTDAMQDGTFTITNLGMYNIKQFTPIINKPQVTILGIGGTSDKPTVQNGQLINKKVSMLSLSFDHRVINGAPAANFCNTIKKLAENPIELIL